MPSILDQVAAQQYSAFRPQAIQEFFALQLARKLNDTTAARYYRDVVASHSEESVIVAYRRAIAASGLQHGSLARNFHAALNRANGHGPFFQDTRVLAIKIERRTVAVAIFRGTQLEETHTRQLSSVRAKAESSAVGFMQWITSNFEVDSAAIEQPPADHDIQRSVLHRLIESTLRDRMLPVLDVSKSNLLSSFGHPEPRSRREVREVIRAVWPVLGPNPGILDAVAVGLYIQTERLFMAAE